MGSFSVWHWAIVLLVVVIIFGTKKLRNLGSDLGGAVKGFKDGMKDGNKPPEEQPPVPAPAGQVTQAVQAPAQPGNTIDVEAKPKA